MSSRQLSFSLLTWNSVHFIQDHEAPFLCFKPLHDSLSLPGPLGSMAQHGVSANGNGAAYGFVLGIRGEAADLAVINSGPHLELGFPLLHRHSRIAQYQTALSDSARSSHTNQGLPSTYAKSRDNSTKGQVEMKKRDEQELISTINLGKSFMVVLTEDICEACTAPPCFPLYKEACPLYTH